MEEPVPARSCDLIMISASDFADQVCVVIGQADSPPADEADTGVRATDGYAQIE